ncbi:MAG TPA: DUF5050 domain-containing protein [Lachnospiraceae bacterium]|nr:DUF5050 domain-containing protein [Lachnospiraceae bacterium]
MKRKSFSIFFFILFIILAILIFLSIPKKITKNPKGTLGNTAGNLNNNGLFCENNGIVFFANAYDNGDLYSMNLDESNIKKISSAIVTSLNADSNYLYYHQNDSSSASDLGSYFRYYGIYRCKKNGKEAVCLNRDSIKTFLLIDNSIYFQLKDDHEKLSLNRMGTDKKKEEKIVDYEINPNSSNNGLIYFNGIEDDHYLYTLDTISKQVEQVYKGNLWNPIFQDNFIYYMNLDDNYSLCRYDLFTNTMQVLSTDRVDYFNVCKEYVYYQTNATDAAFKRVKIDGTEDKIIKNGVFENINITSKYVYFNGFGAPTPVYKVNTYGDGSVNTFDAAKEAALLSK